MLTKNEQALVDTGYFEPKYTSTYFWLGKDADVASVVVCDTSQLTEDELFSLLLSKPGHPVRVRGWSSDAPKHPPAG